MKRLGRSEERRKLGERRAEIAGFWRDDLERRTAPSRRQNASDRRRGSAERRVQIEARLRKQRKNRLLKWQIISR